jgi:hypothetical protein
MTWPDPKVNWTVLHSVDLFPFPIVQFQNPVKCSCKITDCQKKVFPFPKVQSQVLFDYSRHLTSFFAKFNTETEVG